jgi:glutamate 5-kinase
MQFLEANARRVVIKIGTNSLAGPNGQLLTDRIQSICRQIAELKSRGCEVLVISSGAIGMGMGHLKMGKRPTDLAGLQACAAIGQSRLVEAWQNALEKKNIVAAQILLTREDVRGRHRHLAVRDTLEKLLALGVVPVVNENDTVSADEIKFGDNDVLSALVASLVKADLLVILSTIPGLMEDQGNGALIPVVREIDDRIRAMAGGAETEQSTGGMVTKIEAARLATQSGCGVFIADASKENILEDIHSGTATGTFFVPQSIPLASRKRWIAFFEKPVGKLFLDEGAVTAVTERNSSLLAKGITECKGDFPEGAITTLHKPNGDVIAHGIVAFDAVAIREIVGKTSAEIQQLHPEKSRFEIVHRDSLVLV